MRLDYDSPTALRNFLRRHGLAARKRWGQNFLIDPRARARLWEALEAQPGEIIWEVGPGLGCMTALALEAGNPVVAFELDPAYARLLREMFSDRSLTVVQGDVLKTWRARQAEDGWPRVMGNLPYNIAGKLLGDWAEAEATFPRGVFLVQRELAERLLSRPGTKEYSSVSVLVQSLLDLRRLFELGPASFYPRPEVVSTALCLQPRTARPHQARLFARFLRACFGMRRKTLRNNLEQLARYGWEVPSWADHLHSLGWDLGRRAEEFEPQAFQEAWEHPKAPWRDLG